MNIWPIMLDMANIKQPSKQRYKVLYNSILQKQVWSQRQHPLSFHQENGSWWINRALFLFRGCTMMIVHLYAAPLAHSGVVFFFDSQHMDPMYSSLFWRHAQWNYKLTLFLVWHRFTQYGSEGGSIREPCMVSRRALLRGLLWIWSRSLLLP